MVLYSQGKERKYIILSLTRSNERFDIGFMADSRRINVSLSRAKNGLILVGNVLMFHRKKFWSELLKYWAQENCIRNAVGMDEWPSRAAHPVHVSAPVHGIYILTNLLS